MVEGLNVFGYSLFNGDQKICNLHLCLTNAVQYPVTGNVKKDFLLNIGMYIDEMCDNKLSLIVDEMVEVNEFKFMVEVNEFKFMMEQNLVMLFPKYDLKNIYRHSYYVNESKHISRYDIAFFGSLEKAVETMGYITDITTIQWKIIKGESCKYCMCKK